MPDCYVTAAGSTTMLTGILSQDLAEEIAVNRSAINPGHSYEVRGTNGHAGWLIATATDGKLTDGHWPLGTTLPGSPVRVIGCECGAKPKKRSARSSMQHVWHQAHRRGLRLQPVEYVWPDDRYMEGLSTGPYVQVRNAKWENGEWVRTS